MVQVSGADEADEHKVAKLLTVSLDPIHNQAETDRS